MSIAGIGLDRTIEQLRQGPATAREVASALGWTPRRAKQVMATLLRDHRVEKVGRRATKTLPAAIWQLSSGA